VDGSAETDWVADGTNIDIDIVGSGSSTKKAMISWWAYYITTADGIANFWGAYVVESSNSIQQDVSVLDVVVEKTSVGNFSFTDNDVRYYRSDFTSPYDTTGNSIFMDYSGVPLLVETGVSGLTPTESNQLGAIDSVESKVDIIDTNLGTPSVTVSDDIASVQSDVTTIDGNVDAILVDTGTTLPAQIGVVDSNVDAVKVKTDELTFTKANELDANIQSVSGTTVGGTGTDEDPWNPA
jgi:hypothetical protein